MDYHHEGGRTNTVLPSSTVGKHPVVSSEAEVLRQMMMGLR